MNAFVQDELLAELEEMEEAELKKQLLDVGEPSHVLETADPLEDLPAVRKSTG